MCLPQGFLKCVVSCQSFIFLLIALMSIAGAIAISIQQHKVDEYAGSIGYYPGIWLVVWTWIFAFVMLGFAMAGIIGAKKKNTCLLAIYNLGNIIGFLLFLGLTIGGFALGGSYVKLEGESCTSESWSVKLDNLQIDAQSYFCSEYCPCYITTPTAENITGLYYSQTNSSMAQQFQDCPQYTDYSEEYSDTGNLADILSFLETTYSCSGWCSPYEIFVFSNVNDGIPNGTSCYDSTFSGLRSIALTVAYISLVITLILGFCFVSTICLCCQRNQVKEEDETTKMQDTKMQELQTTSTTTQ